METPEQCLKICSKLTIKTPERRRKLRSVAFVNFQHISYIVLVFPFEQANAGWKVHNIYTVTLELFIIRYHYYNCHFFFIIASSRLSLDVYNYKLCIEL